MNIKLKQRILRTIAVSLLAFIVGGGIALMDINATKTSNTAVSSSKGFRSVAGAKIGGAYTLTDHNGKTVTQDTFKDSYKLIYFGFTYCPAICPTELRKISQAMNTLSTQTQARIQPLFITIDPERDIVEDMKSYVELFHPKLIGLSGSLEQIKDITSKYKIYFKKAWTEEKSDYTMDHSSYIYFMSPEDELLSIYKIDDDSTFVSNDIKKRLEKK